ncbi:MAG: hypothetical protein Q8Q46_01825 [Candidatus Giovannonibacteria bacterium]|nr:hypothetical protein [Candidatus Giovannonibacteria bacterium]
MENIVGKKVVSAEVHQSVCDINKIIGIGNDGINHVLGLFAKSCDDGYLVLKLADGAPDIMFRRHSGNISITVG